MESGAVADASPLIALQQIGHLWVLQGMFARLLVPPSVAIEIAPTIRQLPSWLERTPFSRRVSSSARRSIARS